MELTINLVMNTKSYEWKYDSNLTKIWHVNICYFVRSRVRHNANAILLIVRLPQSEDSNMFSHLLLFPEYVPFLLLAE